MIASKDRAFRIYCGNDAQQGFDIEVVGSQYYPEEHLKINAGEKLLVPFTDIRLVSSRQRLLTVVLAVFQNL